MEILATSLVKDDMPLHCADCDHHFALTPDGMTVNVACPMCGGKRLERDQPSPVHSDGDLRDMVDPATQIDQGGNPLQEGIMADYQPANSRDESFASVRQAALTHEVEVQPGPRGIHLGVLGLLHNFHSVTIDGHPVSFKEGFNRGLRARYANHEGTVRVGSHHPAFTDIASKIVADSSGDPSRVGNEGRALMQGIQSGEIPPPPEPESWDGYNAPSVPHVGAFELPMGLFDKQPSHVFIVNPQGKVVSGPHADFTHETLAAKHGLLRPDVNSPHKGNSLGVLHTNGDIDFVQHETNHSAGALGQMLWGHFGQPVVVNPDLKQTTNEERWFGEGATPESVERNKNQLTQRRLDDQLMTPEKQQAITQAEKYRGKPYGYYNNPWINRGGSVTAQVGERTSNMDPYLPWEFQLDPKVAGPAAALLPMLGIGAGEAGAGGLLSMAAPALMKGALMGTGSNLIQGLLGGGGQSVPPPQPQDLSQLAKVADLETPHANPTLHDDPDGDTKQFSDGDNTPSFQNPNNQDSGASGEDNVPGGIGAGQPGMDTFAPDSAALERFKMLLPLITHYHNSPESGANDPLLRELHAMMEGELPGYLDKGDEGAGNELLQKLREPSAIQASFRESVGVYENTMIPPAQMQMGDNQMGLTMQPGGGQPGIGAQGKCPYCGGVQTADGSCPQCGAKSTPSGAALPGQQLGQPSMPQVAPGGVPITGPVLGKTAGDTQGPTTPEQVLAVQDYLISNGRNDEVANVRLHPEMYARELAEIANRPNVTPQVDPNQTPPQPPQPPMDPSQQMPMPGMSAPGMPPAMPQQQMMGSTRKRSWKIALDPGAGNTVNAPAADQQQQRDLSQEQDSSHSWQDTTGAPLVQGQTYTIHNPQYEIPDIARVEQIKPDSIVVTYLGQYQNAPSPDGQPGPSMNARHDIPLEEVQLQNLTFEPGDGSGGPGDQSLENYQDNASAPVNTEPQHAPDVSAPAGPLRSHVQAAQETYAPQPDARVANDSPEDDPAEGVCANCGEQNHITSSMSSATTAFHECYRCGHSWETREAEYGSDSENPHLAWLMNDSGPGSDDFFANYERIQAMKDAGTGSRSLAAIAAKDNRYQEIKDRLDANKAGRTAGAKFTPMEQRGYINESGVARNSDLLDLEGTHYDIKTKGDYDRANAMNVPDEHMFMGF